MTIKEIVKMEVKELKKLSKEHIKEFIEDSKDIGGTIEFHGYVVEEYGVGENSTAKIISIYRKIIEEAKKLV